MHPAKMTTRQIMAWRAVGRAIVVVVTIAFWAMVAWALTGCTTTRYVPVESVRTEYCDRAVETLRVDTVASERTLYIKGDTVVDIRERWRVRVREVHDTTMVCKTDSVAYPVEVPAELTRSERFYLRFGRGAWWALVGAVAGGALWLAVRRFNPIKRE